ncbi:MAG: MATE family efflux transporter, partial [Rikenellaceae bacterium]|nr:MATE family efflux transporter [Rikenellaceae bacterium]
WNFGFLRMGTSGFAAQAYGARDCKETASVMIRALSVSLVLGLLIMLLQRPLAAVSFRVFGGGDTGSLAYDYFRVRVWSAPATLALYVFKGWFIGMQDTRTPMWISIGGNAVNIALSVLFVFPLDMGMAGVALGTTLSEYLSLAAFVWVWLGRYGLPWRSLRVREVFGMRKILVFFAVNGDIFLRTLCLTAVTTFFVYASAWQGDEVLAANALLMQMFTLFSYFMDGFAYTAEALTGRFIGEGNMRELVRYVKRILLWSSALALFFFVLYGVALRPVLSIFTDDESVVELALHGRLWIMAVPVAGFLAFIYDGILIGATRSALMRNVMAVSTAVFFGLYYLLEPMWGGDALWCAFIFYLLSRGVLQMRASRLAENI